MLDMTLLHNIINITNEAIIALDDEQHICLFNTGAERIFGYKAEEMLGQPLAPLFTTEFYETLRQHIERFATSKIPWIIGPHRPASCLRKDGTGFSTNASIRRFIQNRQPIFVISLRDVPDQMQAESLLEAMAHFPSDSPNPLLQVSVDGNVLYGNAAGMELLSWMGAGDQVVPDSYSQAVAQALDTNECVEVEYKHDERVFACLFVPMKSADYVNIYGLEVTERRQAKQVPWESSTREQQAPAHLPAVLWTTDVELKVASASGADLAKLNLDPDEAVGLSLDEFLDAADPNSAPIMFHQDALKGRTTTYEHEWANRTYKVYVEPLLNAQGEIIGTRGIALDITGSKQVEQKSVQTTAEPQLVHDIFPNLYLRLTADGTILDYKSGRYDGLCVRSDDFVGRPLETVLEPSVTQVLQRAVARTLETNEPVSVEYTLPLPAEKQHCEICVLPLPDQEDQVITVVRFITRGKLAEQMLTQRDRYSATLAEVQHRLLATQNDEPLYTQEVLEPLGRASGASRVYVFENHYSPEGELLTSQCAEWVAEGISPRIDDRNLQDLALEALCPRWVETLSQGRVITGFVTDFPESEQKIWDSPDVFSVLVLPLIAQGEFVGFIGFDNCVEARSWGSAEVDLLRTVAVAMSLALERRQAEMELKLERDFARQLTNAMGQGLAVISTEGHFVHVNPACARMVGQSPEALIGMTLFDVTLPADHTVLKEMHTERHPENMSTYEARLRGTDGDTVHALITEVPLQRGERVVGSIAVITDLTEQKQALEALHESEESIRTLYGISAQQTNFATKIQALLAMGCERFGLESGALARVKDERYEIAASHSLDNSVLPGTVYDLDSSYARDTLRAGGPISFEHAGGSEWAGHPAYETLKLEAYLGTPIFVGNKVYGVLSFFSPDPHLEPFKPADREFLRLMAQWVGNAIEREQYIYQLQTYAAEVARKNRALVEARDEALEAARLKSDFLAIMSHEIRTPLNAIIGTAEMLLDTRLDDEQSELGRIVNDAGKTLLTIINDILDYSKIEAGKLVLADVEFEPLAVVEGAADLMSPQSQQKHLSLITFVAPDVPDRLGGDPGRLRQILINIVGNAVKYTDQGEVVVRAMVDSTTEHDVMLRFTVSDTGIGLSEDARRWLFQPFSQADNGAIRNHSGTGLGLAISKRLVEAMGGEIGVESVEGKGATFWFTARFGRMDAAVPAPRPRADLEGLRVLVVDDNATQRDIVLSYLDGWQAAGNGVTSGEQALEALAEAAAAHQPYELVVIDSMLPGMDGFELAHEIQRQLDTRLILLTTLDELGQTKQALQDGFAACLTKPLKREHLYEALVGVESTPPDEPPISPAEIPEAAVVADQPPAAPRAPILLVEDDLVNRRVVQLQLDKLGYAVHAVHNGREALDTLQAGADYALILMDCQLPEMDGFETTQAIRTWEQANGGHTPIVAMTASAFQGDRERCIAAGMDDYIRKPVTHKELRDVLKRWLPEAEAVSQQASTVEPPSAEQRLLAPDMLQNLRDITDHDPAMLSELIDVFLKKASPRLAAIRDAVDKGDAQALEQTAHVLKSSSAQMGVIPLAQLCADLEALGRSGTTAGASELMEGLTSTYQRAKIALKSEASRALFQGYHIK